MLSLLCAGQGLDDEGTRASQAQANPETRMIQDSSGVECVSPSGEGLDLPKPCWVVCVYWKEGPQSRKPIFTLTHLTESLHVPSHIFPQLVHSVAVSEGSLLLSNWRQTVESCMKLLSMIR